MVQVVRNKSQKHSPPAQVFENDYPERGLAHRLEERIVDLGGRIAVVFKVARLFACLLLLGLSIYICSLRFPPSAFVVGLCVAYVGDLSPSCCL